MEENIERYKQLDDFNKFLITERMKNQSASFNHELELFISCYDFDKKVLKEL